MRGIMRSFTSCCGTDMERLLWMSLLLANQPVTESMKEAKSCLSQPNKVIWRKTGQGVTLPCTVTPPCSDKDLQFEWFFFKENVHLRLTSLNNPLKYVPNGAFLHISSLHVNDSGIYHCAAVTHGDSALGSQHVGSGTTLVVREKIKIMVRDILLWLSFVLLSIYSLAIATLIIKKHGCKKKHKSDKKNSTKTKQFRDVLQEMYSRRNLERSKQSVSRSRSPAEAASTDLDSSNDDIYQNV
ncbi:immunoglobulin superfamily member 6 [Sparus aurata]|uniref:immunoglobulin superfamily member 6 n=1 Tax=Sparus aurata TaxID=8175 RepID=UPI0011C17556|nr:immunoglobulin superfamily member 6 [Sparus aurata]